MEEDVDRVRTAAQDRVGEFHGMKVTGDVIERLAQAFESHARRLDNAVRAIDRVGSHNDLGDTSEGRVVTANYRSSATDGDNSFKAVVERQSREGRRIAGLLRQTGGMLVGEDAESAFDVESVLK